jgi:hypothetical protein
MKREVTERRKRKRKARRLVGGAIRKARVPELVVLLCEMHFAVRTHMMDGEHYATGVWDKEIHEMIFQ